MLQFFAQLAADSMDFVFHQDETAAQCPKKLLLLTPDSFFSQN
jgi:hypothetical protein